MNSLAIFVGSLLGLRFTQISEKTKTTIQQTLAIVVLILGIKMSLESDRILLIVISLVIGGVIGEAWQIESRLEQMGHFIEQRMKTKQEGEIAQPFVTATLFYLAGAMAIIGAFESGVKHDHNFLFTKAIMDGVSAIFFTAALGRGVLFSSIPVLIYEGGLSLLASQLSLLIPSQMLDPIISVINATGGVLIIAVGLNLLRLTKISTANLLPGLFLVILLAALIELGKNTFPFLSIV